MTPKLLQNFAIITTQQVANYSLGVSRNEGYQMYMLEEAADAKELSEYIKYILQMSDKALNKAILLIYDNQKQDEKELSKAIHPNRIGFSCVDAPKMSLIAKKLLDGAALSGNERSYALVCIQKYAEQIMTMCVRKVLL